MVEIIPAILTMDAAEAEEMLGKAEGVVERVQIDILDGQFAKNRTIDPSALEDIFTSLNLDFHLMTKEPIDWVEKSVRAMADRIFGQIEMMESQVEFVGKAQEVGVSVGLAIDLDTQVDGLDSAILTSLDAVLVMSVPAGFGGQKFDKSALEKIKRLDEIRARDKTPFKICVDGGITEKNIAKVRRAGADEVSIGRRIFKGDLAKKIKLFRKKAYE